MNHKQDKTSLIFVLKPPILSTISNFPGRPHPPKLNSRPSTESSRHQSKYYRIIKSYSQYKIQVDIYAVATLACIEGTVKVPALYFVFTSAKDTNNTTCGESPPTRYARSYASTLSRAFDKDRGIGATVICSSTHIQPPWLGVQ